MQSWKSKWKLKSLRWNHRLLCGKAALNLQKNTWKNQRKLPTSACESTNNSPTLRAFEDRLTEGNRRLPVSPTKRASLCDIFPSFPFIFTLMLLLFISHRYIIHVADGSSSTSPQLFRKKIHPLSFLHPDSNPRFMHAILERLIAMTIF